MSDQSMQNPGQELVNDNEGEAVSGPDQKGALMAEFKRLASQAKSIDARLLVLQERHESVSRGLPTREESAAKPRRELLADGRLRNAAKKEQWPLHCEFRGLWMTRLALGRETQGLVDRLSALGVAVESPWMSKENFPLAPL